MDLWDKRGGRKGMRVFDRHEEDEKAKGGSGGSEEDDRGQLTLKLATCNSTGFHPL